MHKKKKIILVLILFILMIWSFSCHKKTAYAATSDFQLPDNNYYYGVNQSSIDNLVQSIYDNNTSVSSAGYTPENSYYFLSYAFGTYYVYLVKVNNLSLNNVYGYFFNNTWNRRPLCIFSEFLYLTGSGSQLVTSTAQLKQSVQSGNYTTWGCADYGVNPYSYSRYIVVSFAYSSSDGFYSTSDNDRNWGTSFGTKYIPPFQPSNVLYGLDLGINEIDFYEWLVENDKVNISISSDGGATISGKIPSYIGLSKLGSFIHFYNQFGSNRSGFITNIKDWFDYMNVANQTDDNINILKSTMDSLYQEYLNSFYVTVHPYFGNIPHHRRNIETNTTDDDTTLITDDPNDSTDTSILRDILRGIISINNSVCDGVVSIKNAIDGLDFTVNVSNGGGISDSSGSGSFNSDYTDKGTFDITPIENPPTIPTPADLEPTFNVGSYPLMLGGMANVFLDMLDTMGLKGFYIFVFVLSFLVLKLKGG